MCGGKKWGILHPPASPDVTLMADDIDPSFMLRSAVNRKNRALAALCRIKKNVKYISLQINYISQYFSTCASLAMNST